jgi:hypothetical protein
LRRIALRRRLRHHRRAQQLRRFRTLRLRLQLETRPLTQLARPALQCNNQLPAECRQPVDRLFRLPLLVHLVHPWALLPLRQARA